MTGSFGIVVGSEGGRMIREPAGIFRDTGASGETTYAWGGSYTQKQAQKIECLASNVAPVGATNVPRHWAALACAYFGQPGT